MRSGGLLLLCATLRANPSHHRFTHKLAQRIFSNPTGRGLLRIGQTTRHRYRGVVKSGIAFPHRSQRHIHSLLNEVAIIISFSLNENQPLEEFVIQRSFVVHR
jgi:hypothetical protein